MNPHGFSFISLKLLIVGFAIAMFTGWGLNIAALYTAVAAGASIDLPVALRILGIFIAPVGGILGLFF